MRKNSGSYNRPKATPNSKVFHEICTTFSKLELSLTDSQKFHEKLRLTFMEDSEKRYELEERLDKEKKRNKRLIDVMKGVDSSTDSSPRTLYSSHNSLSEARNAIDTISPVLMQYRYDELYLSHKRCLKLLSQKEKTLREAICEKETIQSRYDELFNDYKNLQKKMEILCCKYLGLRAKKTEEEILNHAVKLIVMHYRRYHDQAEIQHLQMFLQALKDLNLTKSLLKSSKLNV